MGGRAKRMTGGLLGCLMAAGIGAGIAGATPAAAQSAAKPAPTATLRSISVEGFAAMLQDEGYRAETAQGQFMPLIYTGMAGRRVSIGFYDCKDGACGSVQYRLIFTKDADLSTDLANEWNLRKRYAKAHVARDGRFILESDYDLAGGVSTGSLRNSILTFQQMIGLFDQFMRERGEAARSQRPQAPARSAERPA